MIASLIAKSCVEAPRLTFITERKLSHGDMKTGTLKWKYQETDFEEAELTVIGTQKGLVGYHNNLKWTSIYWGPVFGIVMSVLVVYTALV